MSHFNHPSIPHDVAIRLPKEVAIVLFNDGQLSSMGTFIDLLDATQRYVNDQYSPVDPLTENFFEVFKISILGATSDAVKMSQGYTWSTQGLAEGSHIYDAVILANFQTDMKSIQNQSPTSTPVLQKWLRLQHANGALVAASGGACFALAEAGLLKTQTIAAGWWFKGRWRRLFPDTAINMEQAVSEKKGILCSCGASADHALALRLISHLVAEPIADHLGRVMEIERFPLNPGSQRRTNTVSDQLVDRAQSWIQQRFSQPIRINDVAAAMGVSRRTLIRHFNQQLGCSPIEYLQSIRMGAAQRLIEKTNLPINRISALVGYSDVNYFNKLFERSVGQAPGRHRKKTGFTIKNRHKG